MKTVQEWLRNADAEKVIQNYLWEHPVKLIHIRNTERTVTEILEDAKKNLRDLIQYLLTLHAASSEDGIFFASHEWEDQLPEVCAVLCMEKDLMEAELPQHYAWEMTPWEKIMGHRIADTRLTVENANEILAQILFDMTFFGMDHADWKARMDDIGQSLREGMDDISNGRTSPAEEVFARLRIKREEPDEVADELQRAIHRAELEFDQHCLKREARKVRELLLQEQNRAANESISSAEAEQPEMLEEYDIDQLNPRPNPYAR